MSGGHQSSEEMAVLHSAQVGLKIIIFKEKKLGQREMGRPSVWKPKEKVQRCQAKGISAPLPPSPTP